MNELDDVNGSEIGEDERGLLKGLCLLASWLRKEMPESIPRRFHCSMGNVQALGCKRIVLADGCQGSSTDSGILRIPRAIQGTGEMTSGMRGSTYYEDLGSFIPGVVNLIRVVSRIRNGQRSRRKGSLPYELGS